MVSGTDSVENLIYRKMAEQAARERTGELVINGKPAHASILHELIFADADNEMRIFCQKLSNDVFGANKLIQSAKKFLAKSGASLKVIIEDKSQIESNDFINMLLLDTVIAQRIEVRSLDSEEIINLGHFSVNDRETYRVEDEATKRNALARFGEVIENNEKTFASKLVDTFDLLWSETNGFTSSVAIGAPVEV